MFIVIVLMIWRLLLITGHWIQSLLLIRQFFCLPIWVIVKWLNAWYVLVLFWLFWIINVCVYLIEVNVLYVFMYVIPVAFFNIWNHFFTSCAHYVFYVVIILFALSWVSVQTFLCCINGLIFFIVFILEINTVINFNVSMFGNLLLQYSLTIFMFSRFGFNFYWQALQFITFVCVNGLINSLILFLRINYS